MRIQTGFKIGDVVAYDTTPGSYQPPLTPRFAKILSIKVDPSGVSYEMSDDRINYDEGSPMKQETRRMGYWVPEKSIRSRFVPSTDLFEPEAAQ